MGDLPFACDCGALSGRLTDMTPARGSVISCHCRDCRAAEVFHGRPDPGADAGVELVQVSPDRVVIERGQAHLAAIRLSPRGPIRWYAACCGAPLANTAPTMQVPFASLRTNLFDTAARDRMGPLQGRVNAGKASRRQLGIVYKALARAALARLDGRWRRTAFFDPDSRQPVSAPRILSLDERRAATPKA